MNSESVDLIATDPPFNKGRDFHATPDSLAAGAKFQDRWSWERDVHESWVDEIADDRPHLMKAIESARHAHSDGMGAYMCFMAVRSLAMHRVLKPTGSIYLHCDHTASHYLKAIMDAIFGWKNFRNEIVWHYSSGGRSERHFPRKHDSLLFYGKSQKVIFNSQAIKVPRNLCPSCGGTLEKWNNLKKQIDDDGRVFRTIKSAGKIYRYYDDDPVLPPNVWCEFSHLQQKDPERTGWPTQKPLALYERILKASSNEGDIVLDPFAGCATTLVAAETLDRQWVGMDIWEGAHELVRQRLEDATGFFGDVTFTDKPPERTDGDEETAPHLDNIIRYNIPEEPWQKLRNKDIVRELTEAQGTGDGLVICAGCGRKLEEPFMELDHITPRSDRGVNDISNRILLCRPCNGRKGARLTMKGLLAANRKEGWMKDDGLAERARTLAEQRYREVRYQRKWPATEKTGDLFS